MTQTWRSGIGFTGSPMDRSDAMRTDSDALAEAMSSPRSRLLRLQGLDPAVDAHGDLIWASLADCDPDASLLFLGKLDGAACFAEILPNSDGIDARSRGVFRILPMLQPHQAALYGAARSVLDWHARTQFCGRCGSATSVFRAGWGRRCAGCDTEHFPRVDPVVIMLAEYDDKLLLGRQPGFPPGRYSALAGFVEPGESVEEAVSRELYEEAGLVTSDVTYVASQPWPFPSSLMIGCHARMTSDKLVIDRQELEDAIWVDREGIRAAMARAPDAPFDAPPPLAIAYNLLEYWLLRD